MFFTVKSILCFTLLNILVRSQSSPESPIVDGYDIVVTEWVIRNTVNNLFSTLKLKDMKQKLKFQQHSTIHNFFVSITLRDHDNLKEIAKLTQVDNIDNSTQLFITQLNEVLNEDNKSDEETDAVYITILIEEFLKRLDNLKEIHGLKNNSSNFDINQDIIKYLNNDVSDFDNTTTFEKGNDSNYNNLLSDNEFWQPSPSSGRRVFEGRTVKIEHFPFMVSVQFFKKFQCGGSIIKSDLVITSASCLQLAWNNRFFRENPSFLSVHVGSTHYEGGSENIPIIEIYFHPNYNPKNLQHNLAVMRLQRVLKFHSKQRKVKKIEFDKNPWALSSNTDGITIVGWGAKGTNNNLINPWKNKLAYANLDFYPLKECQEIYSKEFVTNRHFCAGFFSKGGGACNRDAGGPGIASGILVGVISFGSPTCGATDAPTVFTKLGFYVDWLEGIMKQKVPKGTGTTTDRPAFKHTTFAILNRPYKTTPFMVKPINDVSKETGMTTVRATFKHTTFAIPNRSYEVEMTTPFMVKPINDVSKKKYKHIPIKELDTLRNKKKDKSRVFKEFLDTMFNNKEVREYLNQIQAEKEKQHKKTKSKKIRHKSKTKNKVKTQTKKKRKTKKKSKTKKKTKSKSKGKSSSKATTKSTTKTTTKTTTKATTKRHFTIYVNQHLKDKVTRTEEDDDTATEYSEEIITRSNKQRNVKESTEESTEDDKKIELVIMSLIDNLDIKDILESEESSPEDNSKEKVQQKKKTRNQYQKLVATESKLNKPTPKDKSDYEEASNLSFNKEKKNTLKVNNEDDKSNENDKKKKSYSDDIDDSEENETGENNMASENNENENKNNEDEDYEEDDTNEINEKESILSLSEGVLDNKEIESNKEETEATSNEIENNEAVNSNDDDEEEISDEDEAVEEEIAEENENNEKDDTYEDESSNESDEDKDYETLSIPTEPVKHSKAKRNDTEKLLQLLAESDDVYELLSKAIQGQT